MIYTNNLAGRLPVSKAISLKINDNLFKATEDILEKIHEPRNSYINKAIDYYNRFIRRNILQEQYARESALIYKESLKINKEFENMDDNIAGL